MTASVAAVIDVRGLERSFGSTPVLRGVDLEVARGTVLALLGAGKMTLVRIFAHAAAGPMPPRRAWPNSTSGPNRPRSGGRDLGRPPGPVRSVRCGGPTVATSSSGIRRRLHVAMSSIGDPPAVFLDEPTPGLDPEAPLEA